MADPSGPAILAVLSTRGPMTHVELAKALAVDAGNVRLAELLAVMVRSGRLVACGPLYDVSCVSLQRLTMDDEVRQLLGQLVSTLDAIDVTLARELADLCRYLEER